jgi:hypothetical protein
MILKLLPSVNICSKRYSARSAAGTGHLLRHQRSCRKNMIMIIGSSIGLL